MYVFKKKYFLIIESIKDINLKNIKKRHKFIIIYRNKKNLEQKSDILKFRNECKKKAADFYIANDFRLATYLSSDGIYLSSHNRSFKALSLKRSNFHIIGSAHSQREIYIKIRQGCKSIILSKLFEVNYDKKAPFLGVIRFRNFLRINKNLIPLGGINLKNINKLNGIRCEGFALMSEIKKKPAIIRRLF